jgi:hypothetical protein
LAAKLHCPRGSVHSDSQFRWAGAVSPKLPGWARVRAHAEGWRGVFRPFTVPVVVSIWLSSVNRFPLAIFLLCGAIEGIHGELGSSTDGPATLPHRVGPVIRSNMLIPRTHAASRTRIPAASSESADMALRLPKQSDAMHSRFIRSLLLTGGMLLLATASLAQIGVAVTIAPGDGYIWAPGYWPWDSEYYWMPGTSVLPPEVGLSVGFYGGIDYGFGYFGHGYEGGRWQNGHFFYNIRVNETPTASATTEATPGSKRAPLPKKSLLLILRTEARCR